MARIRSIHPNACTSEKLAAVGAEAERCYWRLQTHCDDHGKAEDHPRLVWAALFPLHEHVTPAHVDGWLTELHTVGLIVRYEAEGRRYLAVTQWETFQHPQHPGKNRYPDPPEPSPHLPENSGQSHEASRNTHPGVVVGEGEGDDVGGGVGTLVVLTDDLPPVPAIFDAWRQATNRNGRTLLTPDRTKAIKKALGLGYPVEDLVDAVKGWRHDPHCRGENDRETVYNDLELLLRDAKHIEKFRDLERGEGQVPAPRMPRGMGSLQRIVAEREAQNGSKPGGPGDRGDGGDMAALLRGRGSPDVVDV